MNLEISVFTFVDFSLIYLFIILLILNRLQRYREMITLDLTKFIKELQAGLNGIRDILIDGSSSNLHLRKKQGNNLFISQSLSYVSMI